MERYVAYYRVSTRKQGGSGLGLEAQQAAVARYAPAGAVTAAFVEIESGKRDDRPQLAAAMQACRVYGARLLIAKLDRLSRDVAFIANLMKSGIQFVAADMPMANNFTIHILAAVAEHEREIISRRTREALAAAKARGVRLGTPGNLTSEGGARGLTASRGVRIQDAAKRATDLAAVIEAVREQGAGSAAAVARVLNERGIRTPGRRGRWQAGTVLRVLRRAAPLPTP